MRPVHLTITIYKFLKVNIAVFDLMGELSFFFEMSLLSFASGDKNTAKLLRWPCLASKDFISWLSSPIYELFDSRTRLENLLAQSTIDGPVFSEMEFGELETWSHSMEINNRSLTTEFSRYNLYVTYRSPFWLPISK